MAVQCFNLSGVFLDLMKTPVEYNTITGTSLVLDDGSEVTTDFLN